MFKKSFKSYKNNTRIKAFTLPEVLVTLGVIGILSAILIPVVMGQRPDATKILYRKEYGITEKVVTELINDDQLYPSSQKFVSLTDGKSYPMGFYYTTDSTGGANGKNKFCYYFMDKLNLLGPNTCPDAATAPTDTKGVKIGTTTDGADWYLSNPTNLVNQFFCLSYPTSFTYNTRIIVDVNGSKGPNCLTDSGYTLYAPTANARSCNTGEEPDTFIIGIGFNGSVKAGSEQFNTSSLVEDATAVQYLSDPLNNSKD